MKFIRVSALSLVLLGSERALAQGETRGTEYDSLSSLTPAQRYAQICPGPRDTSTGAIIGRVRDIDDSTALANATVSTLWIDVNATTNRSKGHLSSASTKTNNGGFYLLCGVPAQIRLNLRSERGGYTATPAQLVLDDRLIGNLDFSLRRIDRVASDTSLPSSRGAQKLAAVAIDEKAVLPSWMVRSGFEDRRKMGMGAFVTEQDIAKHGFNDLTSILEGVRGVHFFRKRSGGSGDAVPYMLGVVSIRNGPTCPPNLFLDGAPYTDYDLLTRIAHPEVIKGIEVYGNPGTVPAQYDLFSSTGCGSIVIWTR
jgi:hypothetical protein